MLIDACDVHSDGESGRSQCYLTVLGLRRSRQNPGARRRRQIPVHWVLRLCPPALRIFSCLDSRGSMIFGYSLVRLSSFSAHSMSFFFSLFFSCLGQLAVGPGSIQLGLIESLAVQPAHSHNLFLVSVVV